VLCGLYPKGGFIRSYVCGINHKFPFIVNGLNGRYFRTKCRFVRKSFKYTYFTYFEGLK
jgi:hypothetical protein